MTSSARRTTSSARSGCSRDLNCVIALEYYAGEQFSRVIVGRSTIGTGRLFWRLKALAYYLATQHNRTANGTRVDFDADCVYFDPGSRPVA